MRGAQSVRLTIALALACLSVQAGAAGVAADTEFVGTMPCGERVRAFVGGMAAGAACHAITWRLTLPTAAADGSRWRLAARYGIPSASNPNVMVDGPRAEIAGTLDRTTTGYLLTSNGGGTLAFRRVSDGLLHIMGADHNLMAGTDGWSYTLNRGDLAERPADPVAAPDMSYTVSPRATGTSVFGIYTGRSPCAGIARALKLAPVAGCTKVKWIVTLLQKPGTAEPATYKIEGTLHRQQPRQGTWRIVRGTPSNPNAVIYQLDATPTEAPLLLLRGDDNVLFFLNQQRQMLVGTADFSYTLNRTPGA